MHGPPNQTTGRGLLLFAALMLGLGCWLLVGQQWQLGGLWLSIAVCCACYGLLLLQRATGWDKILLGIGLVAGVIAFGLTISLTI